MTPKRAFMMFSSISLVTLFLVSCATMNIPGGIKVSESGFDKSKEIIVKPGWVGNSIKLGLFKNSKMPKDQVFLSVVVIGAKLFSSGKNLKINIDGQKLEFEPIETTTTIETKSGASSGNIYIPAVNESSKAYLVSMDFIDKLNKAKSAVVKVELQNSYVEGEFSSGGYTTAKPGFQEFMLKAKEL